GRERLLLSRPPDRLERNARLLRRRGSWTGRPARRIDPRVRLCLSVGPAPPGLRAASLFAPARESPIEALRYEETPRPGRRARPRGTSCRSRRKARARDAGVWWALRPLGFGSTHRRVSPMRSGCGPTVAAGLPNARR